MMKNISLQEDLREKMADIFKVAKQDIRVEGSYLTYEFVSINTNIDDYDDFSEDINNKFEDKLNYITLKKLIQQEKEQLIEETLYFYKEVKEKATDRPTMEEILRKNDIKQPNWNKFIITKKGISTKKLYNLFQDLEELYSNIKRV